MQKVFRVVFAAFVILITFSTPVFAADVRSGEHITIDSSQKNLIDPYLFGGSIDVNAPVTNDLVAAGGNIQVNAPVTGSVMVAGGDIRLKSNVNQSARLAGGNIQVDGHVGRDLIVAGGSLTISSSASISGDVIFTGGELIVNGPVQGKLQASGGKVTINSSVGKNVDATVGELTLGSKAVIAGDLRYISQEEAHMDKGADIKGSHDFHKVAEPSGLKKGIGALSGIGSLYKLLIDIVISLLIITLFCKSIPYLSKDIKKAPGKNIGVGFTVFALMPLASFILLLTIWLGILSFLLYGVLLIVSIFLANVFLGWLLMDWWEHRNKREYRLDWKAAVLGPVVMMLLMAIPLIGWLTSFAIYLAALGAISRYVLALSKTEQAEHLKKPKKEGR